VKLSPLLIADNAEEMEMGPGVPRFADQGAYVQHTLSYLGRGRLSDPTLLVESISLAMV